MLVPPVGPSGPVTAGAGGGNPVLSPDALVTDENTERDRAGAGEMAQMLTAEDLSLVPSTHMVVHNESWN